MKKESLKLLACISGMALLAGHSARAATYSWDADPATSGNQTGNGTWNTTNNNWINGTNTSWVNGGDASFPSVSSGAAEIITLGENISGGRIDMSSGSKGNVTITDGGSSNTLAFSGFYNNQATYTLTIDAVITGGDILKGNLGRVIFTKNNTYTGTTTITGNNSQNFSALQIGNGGTTGSLGGGNVIFSQGTGQSNYANLFFNRSDTITVGNNFTYDTSLANMSATIKALVVNDSATGNVTLTGTQTLNANKVQFAVTNSARRLTLSGVISGTGSVGVGRSGTVALTGTNVYTGTTTVDSGTLLINGDNSGATGAVTVASGATLGGTGIIGGATTISAGGKLAAGDGGVGQLTFNSSLTLGSTTTSLFEINGVTAGTDFDSITVGGNMTYAGILSLSFGFTPSVNDTFQLFSVAGTKSGNFASLTFTNPGFAGTFDVSTGTLTVTAVPEPSAWALLTVSLVIVVVLVRRFQKKSALAS